MINQGAQHQPEPSGATSYSLHHSIEALLFVAREPLSIERIAHLTHATEPDVAAAAAQLRQWYANRGFVVQEGPCGYSFAPAPTAHDLVESYLFPPKTTLSAAALETLAIVAYVQPVTKGDIEALRRVDSSSAIATLLERNFIAQAGRKDAPGRPVLYETTAEFLEAFELSSIEDLPAVGMTDAGYISDSQRIDV